MALAAGQRFDRYIIVALLGEGGMGQVYSALDSRLGRKIALKVLHEERSRGEDTTWGQAVARMQREARAAAALAHPNVVAVYDVGSHDDVPFIAMELIEGASLRQMIGKPELPLEKRLRWIADVARGLAAAHAAGLVHRDVKPENVMVRSDGLVKVLDFGIARRISMQVAPDHPTDVDVINATTRDPVQMVTSPGVIRGTPAYMSPEQLRGDEVDARADQFAWGVLAYELIAGKLPWGSHKEAVRLLAAVIGDDPPRLGSQVPEIDPAIEDLIHRALAKRPENRLGSLDEAVATIDVLVSGASLRPPSAPRVSRPDVATTEYHPTPPRAPPAPPARPAARSWLTAALSATIALAVAATTFIVLRARAFPAARRAAPQLSARPEPSAETATTSEPARAAYRAALQAYHDGTHEAARTSLDQAIALDPSFAAAHLRAAFWSFSTSQAEARRSFQKAAALRARLDAHDQALLDATEPRIAREPPDLAEGERRLRAVLAAYPSDADVLYKIGVAEFEQGRIEEAVKTFEETLRIDPTFVAPLRFKAQFLAYLGRIDDARAALATCLKQTPVATGCHVELGYLDEMEGRCSAMEASARATIARNPDGATGYAELARAAASKGAPEEAVREMQRQAIARIPAAERPNAELAAGARLDALHGRFAAAVEKQTKLEELLAGDPAADAHGPVARAIVMLDLEMGRPEDAVRVAKDHLLRRGAWMPNPRADDWAIEADPSPLFFAVLHRHGGASAAEHDSARRAWLESWQHRSNPFFVRYLWPQGFALAVDGAQDAEAALAALDKGLGPLPEFWPKSMLEGDVGRTLLLGGRRAEALRFLRRAATSCHALDAPIEHTRAQLYFADALASEGDKHGACDALAVIASRWGRATPSSVTATAAAKRSAALACAR